ncbi:hypothetical protein [Yersinia sp. 2105 StPb PI]|uniref:hypothetical protein n=1 Tax=Yersinia sp. 2105 StPb PI TaxID=2507058 RepID=UPI000FFBB812|nr:hypothetical protein [Yersinia sp. 2105 StPb PI]RXA96928.1 hypothetical protein EQP49_05985 [Yersinia sp. 2105 StPb PI]
MKHSEVNNQDIHKKLRESKSHWSYLFDAKHFNPKSTYQLQTCFVGEFEYAIYERIENYFVLVDFFNSYESANEQARKIIDECEKFKNSIVGYSDYKERNLNA